MFGRIIQIKGSLSFICFQSTIVEDTSMIDITVPSTSNNAKESPESKTHSPPTTVRVPIKTVIKIESPRMDEKAGQVEPPVSNEKRDSDSVSSTSSLSQNSSSDQEVSPLAPKRMYRSPTLEVRKRVTPFTSTEEQPEYMNSPRGVGQKANAEYMNIGRSRKIEGGNGSDTDSGVGGESDRPAQQVKNGGQSRKGLVRQGEESQDEIENWEGSMMDTGSLLHTSELQLDLSKY